MKTTYFLGAGASAADGLPITRQLNFGVAGFLAGEGRESALREYYRVAFAVEPEDVRADAKRWRAYVAGKASLSGESRLPNLVEALSVLDVCIAEGRSLGPARQGRARRGVELSNEFLRRARAELVDALRVSIVNAVSQVRKRDSVTARLLAKLTSRDVIVTTNWDHLVEKRLANDRRTRDGGWQKSTDVEFGCIGERIVNWRGDDIPPAPEKRRLILKLHGGVNWYLCERCQNLYINVEYMPGSLEKLKGDTGGCHCGAELYGLIVAPSYLKDYNSGHLRSVWIRAQKELESSARWVFLGYSLPDDDFHIRALLLRALCVRRNRGGGKTEIHVVTRGDAEDASTRALFGRFEGFFRKERIRKFTDGMDGYVTSPARARGAVRKARTR